jgi:two-component system, cell cycle response regulator
MLERLKNAMRGDEKPPPRKTTEVRVDTLDPDPLERSLMHEPALVTLEGDLPGQVFRLKPGRQIIGRRPECDIRVRERAVSGIHAEVIRVRDNVTINDLASTNGTVVNGMRIRTPVPLLPGTLVKLGNCVFRFVDSLLEVEFTEALHSRGITDALTGAFNKSYVIARLGFMIDLASDSHPVAVITFDFDNFKQVNDQFGHAAGDHVLKATCDLITGSFVRDADLFARIGGEEFVIALPDTTTEQAVAIAERIRRTLEDTVFTYDGLEIRLTSSFGVCSASSPMEQPESVLLRVDELLYRAKREGRNRVSA